MRAQYPRTHTHTHVLTRTVHTSNLEGRKSHNPLSTKADTGTFSPMNDDLAAFKAVGMLVTGAILGGIWLISELFSDKETAPQSPPPSIPPPPPPPAPRKRERSPSPVRAPTVKAPKLPVVEVTRGAVGPNGTVRLALGSAASVPEPVTILKLVRVHSIKLQHVRIYFHRF